MSWLPETIQERLVIVLAHFVWQGVAVAILVGTLVALLNIKRPSTRYATSLLAFLLMSACPIVTWFVVPDPGVRWLDTALQQSSEQPTVAQHVDDVLNDELPKLAVQRPANILDQSRDQRSFDAVTESAVVGVLRRAAALVCSLLCQ